MRAAGAVVIGKAIGPMRGSNVDLNHYEVGLVVQIERLNVLVLNLNVVVIVQICRQRGKAKWWEQ